MERYMYQDDSFERMLKQKADEYKMYPSGNVWESIQQRVQKKTYLFNLKSTTLTIILLTAFSLYISNNQDSNTKLSGKQVQNLIPTPETPALIIATNHTSNHKSVVNIEQPDKIIVKVDENNNAEAAQGNDVAVNENSAITNQPVENTAPVTINSSEETKAEITLEKAGIDENQLSLEPEMSTTLPEQKLPALITSETIVTEPESETLKTDAELNYEVNIPLLIKPKLKKEIQYYVTPSASYRILFAENLFTFGNIPQQDPNNAVTHKPALGFEAGASVRFPMSPKFRFIAGLQVNYTRYTVNAYQSSPQLTTVRLNYAGVQQRVSTLNNSTGFYPNAVANETYQVSVPLGMQLQVAGNSKIKLNIGADVQPTYMMKATGYLITNDYTKYIKAPDLLSHLNLNTSFQTFLSWDAKSFRLMAGPQFRYQLFSNAPEYPIQEHLIDYGFRIGIVKTLK